MFHTTLKHTIQHAACSFDPFDIPWILQNLLFSQTSFWKISLIFPIIYQIAHLHYWPTCPLIFANSCPRCQNYPVLTGLVGKRSNSLSSLIYFIETRHACILSFFRPFQHTNYIEIIRLVDQSCQNQSS